MCANVISSPEWIQTVKGHPYFITDTGGNWTPIGQNDAITWPDLKGLFLRKNFGAVEEYFKMQADHGVTCMRLMLEYCQTEHRYFENPVGRFQSNMIAVWDDLFTLAEKYSIRFLLTPFDTFWMKRRWHVHPYNKRNGGPCASRTRWLISPAMRTAIKNRLRFVTERWGGSGVIFGWDLWNEIHPANARNEVNELSRYIEDVGGYLRETEMQLFGRAHLQTVSFYGTSLLDDHRVASNAFRHPMLDFATIHFYDEPAIDKPKNTIDAAVVTGTLTRNALTEITDNRPFFDSEHGPIYTFNNKHKTADEAFDDAYFHNMQWAHVASGGTGGGMRWPYRNPHVLTKGMRNAQKSLSEFCKLVDWRKFSRAALNEQIRVSDADVEVFSCGNSAQAIVWILKKKTKISNVEISFHQMHDKSYFLVYWDTKDGKIILKEELKALDEQFAVNASFEKDLLLFVSSVH